LGQKVHPLGFRLGVIKGWSSRWYASEKNYKDLLAEDIAIRKLINKKLINAGLARIEIERVAGTQISVTIYTAKPGVVIGKNGEKVEDLRVSLEKLTKKKVHPKIMEIRQPELEAELVAQSIAEQLEKRISFRRAMKQAVQKSMKAGAKGIKIMCAGRLGGAEIARTEREVDGSVPLQTLRADIDFAIGVAHTTYGTIGIKVWIYRGDILPGTRRQVAATPAGEGGERAPRREGRRDDRGPRRDGGRRDDRGPRRDGGGGYRGGSGGGGGFRQAGEGGPRPPRPQGEGGPRPPRPQGEGGPRPPRPQGDRPPRPAGEGGPRPQGERPPRPAGPVGEGGPRPPRPAGEAGPRPPRPTNEASAENPAPAPAPAPEQKPESE
jgi:small subunit ribosomal protein S3